MIGMDTAFSAGGGQVLCSARALPVITGKRMRLTAIRARRPQPGLHPRHLRTNAGLLRDFLSVSVAIAGEIDQPGQVRMQGTAVPRALPTARPTGLISR